MLYKAEYRPLTEHKRCYNTNKFIPRGQPRGKPSRTGTSIWTAARTSEQVCQARLFARLLRYDPLGFEGRIHTSDKGMFSTGPPRLPWNSVNLKLINKLITTIRLIMKNIKRICIFCVCAPPVRYEPSSYRARAIAQ